MKLGRTKVAGLCAACICTVCHRAIAYGQVFGSAAALTEVSSLATQLDGYHLYHATRAALLRDLGRVDDAREADAQALRRTANPAERALLEQRLATPSLVDQGSLGTFRALNAPKLP